MAPLIAQALSSILLGGSLVVMWGTLVLAISMTESYRQRDWSVQAGKVGTIAMCAGTAIAFLGNLAEPLSGTDATILNGGLSLMALTVVLGLLAPRIRRPKTEKPRADRRNNEREGHGIDAQEDNDARASVVNAEGLKRARQDIAEQEHGDDFGPKVRQPAQEATKP